MRLGERVKKITGRVKELVGKMSKGLKRAIILVLILAVAAIVALIIVRANRPYAVLFADLSAEDMSSVLTYLDENNVTDIKLQDNNTILVRESQVDSLKAAIWQEGYPSSGYGYETYLNNIGMLSSETDRRQLSTYDLQDQLADVIRRFDGVREARVIIATASNNRYILSENTVEATATVFVEMAPGKTLTEQQVEGIRDGVTHAVLGLDFSSVSILDPSGVPYTGGGQNASLSDSANLKLSLQSQIDTDIRNKILAELIPLYGLSNISVSVTSTVDVSHSYSEELMYHEPEWAEENANGRGIIGQWVWDNGLIRGDNATASGVVGTTTNADLPEYIINTGDIRGDEQEIGSAGEINYNVSQTTTQTESPGGVVTDLMVAVIINSAISEQMDTPISANRLVPIVARAAGIGSEYEDEKVAIAVLPFYTDPNAPGPVEPTGLTALLQSLPWWVPYAAIAGGVLFVILLVVALLLIRKAKKRKKQREEEERLAAMEPQIVYVQAEQEEETPPEQGADIMNMTTERTMELRRDVRQFAEENPAIAAQMIKNWMHGGEDQ